MLICVVVGSDSDKPVLAKSDALKVLDKCGILYEASVISAERNPGALNDLCDQMIQKGVRAFIAGAGRSARLPGNIAAKTKYRIPVIGVALTSPEFPDALDAMLSIARSPSGCPVILAGIGDSGFTNAAMIAVQILADGEDEESCRIKTLYLAYRQSILIKPEGPFATNK